MIESPIVDAVEVSEINEPPGTESRTSPRLPATAETVNAKPNETTEEPGNEPRTTLRVAKWLLGLGLLVTAAIGGRVAYVKIKG